VTGVRELVGRFYAELWNAWDDTAVVEVLAEDFAFRGSLGTSTHGRDGWRTYRDQIRAGAPDFRNEILALVVEGSRAAARLRYSGTHTGPLAGLPASGRRFGYDGAAFFEARGGLLVSAWVLGDLASLRDQLTVGNEDRGSGDTEPVTSPDPTAVAALHADVAARLKRSADGLVPAIVQQHDSGEVLMLGWMDDEALARTLSTGRATYWSRSRGEYWVKGETSGHRQWVKEVRLDCDGDALLVKVDQEGPACHTGDRTCFDADLLLDGSVAPDQERGAARG